MVSAPPPRTVALEEKCQNVTPTEDVTCDILEKHLGVFPTSLKHRAVNSRIFKQETCGFGLEGFVVSALWFSACPPAACSWTWAPGELAGAACCPSVVRDPSCCGRHLNSRSRLPAFSLLCFPLTPLACRRTHFRAGKHCCLLALLTGLDLRLVLHGEIGRLLCSLADGS